jgi:hypothetical protein
MRVATSLMAIVVLITLYVVSTAFQNEPQNTNETTINLTECKAGTRVTYSKFGSEKVTTKGRRKGRCVIERTSEQEGAYVTSECRLPISLKKLSIREKPSTLASEKTNHRVKYFSDVKKYCKVIKKGNLLDVNN